MSLTAINLNDTKNMNIISWIQMYKQSQKFTNAQIFHQFWSHETHYGTSISEMSGCSEGSSL